MRRSKGTALYLLGAMTVFLAFCGGGRSKKESFLFLEKAKGLGGIIIKQASGDVSLCNMYNTVWEYAKVTDLDFQSAYREMRMNTTEIKAQVATNKLMMDDMMDMVKNPPENMKGIHDKLVELREQYLEFNAFVLELPQVSQETFYARVEVYLADIDSLKSELDNLIAEAEANLYELNQR
jgi:hypothetical protein